MKLRTPSAASSEACSRRCSFCNCAAATFGPSNTVFRAFARVAATASGACWLIRVAISIARCRSLPGATTSWTNPNLKAVSASNSSPVKRYRKALPKPARSVIRMVAAAEGMIPRFTSICANGDNDVRGQHQLDPEREAIALDGGHQRFSPEPALQVDRINVVCGEQWALRDRSCLTRHPGYR